MGDGDLAEPGLGLAQVHQRLEVRVRERLALEERHHTRVCRRVLGRAGAG